MNLPQSNQVVKTAAEIAHVREVGLHGTADLGFWRERLRPDHLVPAERNGKARLLVSGTDARFKGIRFRELTVTVEVLRHDGATGPDGAFLVHAYNSIRFFAWVERTWFATPYYHGQVRVGATTPVFIELTEGGGTLFRAAMSAMSGREPVRSGPDEWAGPVFLPRRRPNTPYRVFFARLSGDTRVYPFLSGQDVFSLPPEGGPPVFQLLRESGFTGTEWVIRDDATHTKSKTVRRSDIFPA